MSFLRLIRLITAPTTNRATPIATSSAELWLTPMDARNPPANFNTHRTTMGTILFQSILPPFGIRFTRFKDKDMEVMYLLQDLILCLCKGLLHDLESIQVVTLDSL